MFKQIKKFMPTGILAVGFLIYIILNFIKLPLMNGIFRYESLLLAEQLGETASAVFAECLIAALLFKFCLIRKKVFHPMGLSLSGLSGCHGNGQRIIIIGLKQFLH